jgi:hypothetical protein
MNCESCGTTLTPKNRPLLFAVGVAMIASVGFALTSIWFLLLAVPLAIMGIYFIMWSTRGEGQWCRSCKKAPLL